MDQKNHLFAAGGFSFSDCCQSVMWPRKFAAPASGQPTMTTQSAW
jgi:hypothetical protein